MFFQVAAGQLDAGEDELDAEDEAGEGQGDGVEVLVRAEGVVERADEVGARWGEGDAGEEGDY